MQDPDTLLQTLAQSLGFETLVFEPDGVCSLAFEERFTVTLERDDENGLLHLYSTLGSAPDDVIDQLTCFAALLQANLFGRGTADANLGYEPDSQTLMLSRKLVLQQLDGDSLQTAFGLFIQATETWSQRIAERFWENSEEDATDFEDGATDHVADSSNPVFIKV